MCENHINWTSLVSSLLSENSCFSWDVTKPDYVMKKSAKVKCMEFHMYKMYPVYSGKKIVSTSAFYWINPLILVREIAELFLSLKTMQISKTGNICKKSCKCRYYRKTSNCYFKLLNKRPKTSTLTIYFSVYFFLDSYVTRKSFADMKQFVNLINCCLTKALHDLNFYYWKCWSFAGIAWKAFNC